MLPRVASTTGISPSAPALAAGASGDAAVKPHVYAAALADLRASVLLRLLETVMKHMPRTAEPNPGRELVESLVAALKAMPGENARKLAELIAKLPAELRPNIEKLIGTVLSAMPTRGLVEIVRNPNGPEAQRLAGLLAASLQIDGSAAERPIKPVGLNPLQLAAVGRHTVQQMGQAAQMLGDIRALQAALKRIYDLDSGGKAHSSSEETAPAGTSRLTTEIALPTPTARASTGQPVDTAEAALRHHGAEGPQAVTHAGGQISGTAGPAHVRGLLEAVTPETPIDQVMQAVAHLMEALSPEEANLLRTLLDRPLDPASPQELAMLAGEQAEEPTEAGKPAPVLPHNPAAELDEDLPAQPARIAAQPVALPGLLPDRLPAGAILRDGVPLAFVPYLPAEEDIAWPQEHEAEKDEAGEDDPAKDDGAEAEGGAQEENSAEAEPEPESPDMARRREKTAEMVGVMEPGLVFYQKLGDYWT